MKVFVQSPADEDYLLNVAKLRDGEVLNDFVLEPGQSMVLDFEEGEIVGVKEFVLLVQGESQNGSNST